MNKQKTKITPRIVSGFILIETIVAVSILMLALPAALTVASRSITLASYSKDQIIATYLAQEGLEIIRNKRDQNMLKIAAGTLDSSQWNDGFMNGVCMGLQCRVDYGPGNTLSPSEPLIQKCISNPCTIVLNRNTADNSYSHASGGTWVPTKFSRYVQTDNIPAIPNEIRVTSVVTYATHGVDKTITLRENLTNWLQ